MTLSNYMNDLKKRGVDVQKPTNRIYSIDGFKFLSFKMGDGALHNMMYKADYRNGKWCWKSTTIEEVISICEKYLSE